jgi:hypothetical protein
VSEKTVFHQPKNTLPKIDSVYLFVSVDEEDGNEGVIGAPFGPINCMPLIAADEKRLAQLIPIAEDIARRSGKKIRLIRLTQREVIQDITP